MRDRLIKSGVDPAVAGDVARYLGMVERFGRVADLVGGRVKGKVLVRHAVEALAALPHLPSEGRLVDVGTGNGLPAVPILLARRGLSGTLLEPRERRWAFLQEVVRELALDARVVRERAAEHGDGPYDVLTVRGLAQEDWAVAAERLVRPGGLAVWWTTPGAAVSGDGFEPVITSPLPDAARGALTVWRRCFT